MKIATLSVKNSTRSREIFTCSSKITTRNVKIATCSVKTPTCKVRISNYGRETSAFKTQKLHSSQQKETIFQKSTRFDSPEVTSFLQAWCSPLASQSSIGNTA